jgi:hypothetical protein
VRQWLDILDAGIASASSCVDLIGGTCGDGVIGGVNSEQVGLQIGFYLGLWITLRKPAELYTFNKSILLRGKDGQQLWDSPLGLGPTEVPVGNCTRAGRSGEPLRNDSAPRFGRTQQTTGRRCRCSRAVRSQIQRVDQVLASYCLQRIRRDLEKQASGEYDLEDRAR